MATRVAKTDQLLLFFAISKCCIISATAFMGCVRVSLLQSGECIKWLFDDELDFQRRNAAVGIAEAPSLLLSDIMGILRSFPLVRKKQQQCRAAPVKWLNLQFVNAAEVLPDLRNTGVSAGAGSARLLWPKS